MNPVLIFGMFLTGIGVAVMVKSKRPGKSHTLTNEETPADPKKDNGQGGAHGQDDSGNSGGGTPDTGAVAENPATANCDDTGDDD